ncbi:ABC transporter ATP-binding protein [Phycisphaeraceae bacterium D3-23]
MTHAEVNPLLVVEGLSKSFPGITDGRAVNVLSGVTLSLERGDSIAIVGPSGCGKSTLLNILGTLDTPTAGTIRFMGEDLAAISESKRVRLRAQSIGFVFQEHHLLPQCTAIENTLIPTLAKGVGKQGRASRAAELLDRVGLSNRMGYRPDQLSGGQRQRVALVRALINQPALLLVDEPTGALDGKNADQIIDLLIELNQAENTAMLMVTHATHLAQRLDRTLRLEAGTLVDGGAA